MNINNAFPSKYLKSGDLGSDDLTLTMSHVEEEVVGQDADSESKPIVYFEEVEKGFVLNKTNAGTISALYTPETDNWKGKRITLFATEVAFQGKQTLAIRVRSRVPAATSEFTPVPVYASEALAMIGMSLTEAIVGLKPTDKVAADGKLVAAFKTAREQARTRNLTAAIEANKATASSTNLATQTYAVNLLNACVEADAPPF